MSSNKKRSMSPPDIQLDKLRDNEKLDSVKFHKARGKRHSSEADDKQYQVQLPTLNLQPNILKSNIMDEEKVITENEENKPSVFSNFTNIFSSGIKKLFTGGESSASVKKTAKIRDENEIKIHQKRHRKPKRVTFQIEPIKLPFLIRMLYKFAEPWEWLSYGMALVSFGFITYVSVFSFYEEALFDVVFTIDLIFLLDTNIRVIVEIWRYKTGIPCLIFITPYTFIQYIGDMFSLFPFERFYIYIIGDDDLTYLGLFDFYRYNRFIRFWRVYNFLDVALKEGRISEKLAFILEYATMYLSFIHLVSCAFYLLLPTDSFDVLLQRNAENLHKHWIKDLYMKKPKFGTTGVDYYILSLSFGAAVVTTTGYGELTPKDVHEMVVAIFVMLIGAVVLAGLFSSGLTNFELNHDGARFDLFFRVRAMLDNLKYIGTSSLFREKVHEYYSLLWNYREGVYDVQMLHQLPSSMQSDVLYDICQEMFHKSQLFRSLDESFLRTISRVVKVVLYNPDMILCAKGSYAISMFYLIQGEVRVKSKFGTDSVGAILRAGCIMGEMNLLFSFPYTTTLETRTSCQLLLIEKMDFLQILESYTTTFETVRHRVQTRINELRKTYEVIGDNPISWVEYKGNLLPGEKKGKVEFPVNMRRGSGLNPKVTEDIVDDTEDIIIIDMPCLDPKLEKTHILVYKNCLIPPILKCKEKWVQTWVMFILVRSLYGAFMGPYCLTFRHTSSFEDAICSFDFVYEYSRVFINILDLFIEITRCVPVEGIYYQFTNGIRIKCTELNFFIDLASCIPFELNIFHHELSTTEFILACVIAILRSLKLWKILRYFNYMDNIHPTRLFTIRLIQTILIVLFAMHYLSCILFGLACPLKLFNKDEPPKCIERSWLSSYEILVDKPGRNIQYDYLAEEYPYLISFYFACATLSTTGFGDFNPQNWYEMLVLVFFQLVGFSLIGYYTALLTSALSCIVRPKLLFQQKLVAIRQFMEHHCINEILQHRVIEHYTLQDQLLCGVNLPRLVSHFMFDAPDYLLEDALYQDVALLFDGVPILTKLDVKTVVQITKLMRRYLIPPGSIFLRKGEVRRQMYLIARGSVGVMADDQDKPVRILEATGHFGLRDLLFGEPAHFHIKTLSYCLLYEIERQDLNFLFEEEPETFNLVEQEKRSLQTQINKMTSEYSRYRLNIVEKPKRISSWIQFPWKKLQNMEHCTFFEYEELFEKLKFQRAYRFVLMRKTIHPAGSFAKWWLSAMSLLSCLTLASLILESFMQLRTPWFRFFQLTLDLINYLDIYVKMHWAYYNKKSIFVCHPMMTMMNYVFDGSFLFDVLCCAPFELIVPILESSNIYGYSNGAYWYSKLRWTRLGQIARFPAVVEVCHNIFQFRNQILLSLYISVTLVLCTALFAVASNIACPIIPRLWQDGDQYHLPYCTEGSWAFKKTDLLDTVHIRWIYGIYYVSQVIFAIGFGDMITLNGREILLLIAMMVNGYILAICVLADITAAEVDIDETRATYLEEMKCLRLIMAREKVHRRLMMSVTEHLKHTWVTSKGLQPKQLFYDLHPALEADMFRDLVGDLLKKVPIFSSLTENIVRAICQYMKKLHFLKGERIIRFGNLEYEMYIIVEGKVWIRDSNKEWFTTLGVGSSFGEAAMINGHKRKYSAIAASLVEVFVLTSEDFTSILESYPKLQEEMGGKIKGNEDIFEKILKSSKKKKAKESKYEIKKPFLTGQINHLLEIKDHPNLEEITQSDKKEESLFKRFLRKFIGYGRDDDNLPFIYFATKRTKFSPLIHPDCSFMKYFSSFIVWISFITPALASYEISFSNISNKTPQDEGHIGEKIQEITKYIEIPMYMHIIFGFITPMILFEGIYCKTFKGIAFNYATSLTRFPLDAIAAFPVSFLIEYGNLSEIWRYLFLVRFLRLVHFYRVQFSKKDDLSTSTFKYKITLAISSFLLMAHTLACIFYLLAPCKCEQDCKKTTSWEYETIRKMCERNHSNGWTVKFVVNNEISDIEEMAPWKWYIRSLYWVVTTVTTTGFGDITAENPEETIMAIVCIFCGAFGLSIILSQFTSGAASLGQAHREYFYRVNLLSKYLSNIGLSQNRKYLLNAYFLMSWESCRGVNYHDATDILPLTMKIEVCHSLYFDIMKKCKLFYHIKDKTFLRQVGVRLKHSMFLTGSNVVNEGEQGESLFIVFKGCVFGHSDRDGKIDIKKKYNPGHVFGRLPALFYDQSYTKTYRSESHTEILSLSQSDILHLIQFYPDFKKQLQLLVLHKYDRRTTTETIFQMKTIKKGLYDVANMKAQVQESEASSFGPRPKTKESYLEEYRNYQIEFKKAELEQAKLLQQNRKHTHPPHHRLKRSVHVPKDGHTNIKSQEVSSGPQQSTRPRLNKIVKLKTKSKPKRKHK